MIYTQKIQKAIKFAIKTHDVYQKQKRRGKDVAYITHPLTVGLILARIAHVDEDVIVAGILHDTIEDSVDEKKVTYDMLNERFGTRVAMIVHSVTEVDKTLSWEDRKAQALQDVEHFGHESLMVKSADVIANYVELIDDHARKGDEIFRYFHAPKHKLLVHHMALIDAIVMRWSANPLMHDLLHIKKELQNIL